MLVRVEDIISGARFKVFLPWEPRILGWSQSWHNKVVEIIEEIPDGTFKGMFQVKNLDSDRLGILAYDELVYFENDSRDILEEENEDD